MNHPDTVSFMSAQITIANWYLDRATHASAETSSHYVRYAQQACDIVSQLLPTGAPDETSAQVQRELSVLRERLRVLDSRRNSRDARATSARALHPGSSLRDSDS
jgi:hypothetical protein